MRAHRRSGPDPDVQRRPDEPPATAPAPPDVAAVMRLQQSAGNAQVSRLLGAGGAGRPVLQRKEEAPATADPAAAAAATPAAAPAVAPAAGKSANVTLTALYENVPGEARDKVKRTDADDALWFDPLTMLSNHPQTLRNTKSYGVVAGGQKTVDQFRAPITEGAKPVGRGSVSAQLKYAAQRNRSFNVQVAGVTPAQKGKAEAAARKVIEREIDTYGDVDQIAKIAQQEIEPTFPGAQVSFSTVKDRVMDAGQSTFYYKVRNDAGILMEVQVVPVGEKHTQYSGSQSSGKGTEDESSKRDKSSAERVDVHKDVKDSQRKTEQSKELVEIQYNEAVAKTLDDYVTKATDVHDELASDLAETVVKDSTYNEKDVWTSKRHAKTVEDYTKKVESGQRDKENWAAKAKKIIQGAKKVTSIPWVDKIPGIGWFTRRVKGWQLDVAEWVADQFAETGKVNFEDTKIDKDTTITDDTDVTKNRDVKRHDVEETKRKLREDYKSHTKEDWERHLKELTTTAKDYRSRTTKDSVSTDDKTHTEDYSKTDKKDETESAERRKATEHKSTTTTFTVSSTWKYTAPVVKATVVSGDAEVGNVPFTPDPDEQLPPKP